MSRVDDLMDKIRSIFNISEVQHIIWEIEGRDKWAQICVSMDTIGDCEYAIREYKNDKSKYLRLYGLLQSFFLEQDAVYSLYACCFPELPKKNIFMVNYPELSEVRRIRNESIGHPTNVDGFTFCTIPRCYISENVFELWSRTKDDLSFKMETIDIPNLTQQQQESIYDILSEFYKKLQGKYHTQIMY